MIAEYAEELKIGAEVVYQGHIYYVADRYITGDRSGDWAVYKLASASVPGVPLINVIWGDLHPAPRQPHVPHMFSGYPSASWEEAANRANDWGPEDE